MPFNFNGRTKKIQGPINFGETGRKQSKIKNKVTQIEVDEY